MVSVCGFVCDYVCVYVMYVYGNVVCECVCDVCDVTVCLMWYVLLCGMIVG